MGVLKVEGLLYNKRPHSRTCLEIPPHRQQKCDLSRQVVSGDRLSYIECRSFCRKCVVCWEKWSLDHVNCLSRQVSLYSELQSACLSCVQVPSSHATQAVTTLTWGAVEQIRSVRTGNVTAWWTMTMTANWRSASTTQSRSSQRISSTPPVVGVLINILATPANDCSKTLFAKLA